MPKPAPLDLAEALTVLRSAREKRSAAAIRIHGYEAPAGQEAFTAITRHARRLGFAVICPVETTGGGGGPASPLLEVMVSLIEVRPKERPLLIGITGLDRGDRSAVDSMRFMSKRLAREPLVWVVTEETGAHQRHESPQIECGAAFAVLSRGFQTDQHHDNLERSPYARLTPAETRVTQLVCAGSTNAAAAQVLGVSPHTVGTQLRSIFEKLEVRSRVQLVNVMNTAG